MAKPYDDTTRFLTGLDALAWAHFLGLKAERAELCNADLSTVATAADAIIIIDGGRDTAHIEQMSYYDPDFLLRLVFYNVLGRKNLGLPMRSFLVLLCAEADNPALTGIMREYHSDGSMCHEFHYKIVRVWRIPAEELFQCGLGVLPLAFIGAIDPENIPGLVHRAEERLAREVTPTQAAEMWTAIDILMGLRYDRNDVAQWLKGVHAMKNSVTYQAIVEEGEARGKIIGIREQLIRQVSRRFGPPDAQTLAALEAADSCAKLDDLDERSLIVSSWKELLAK